MTKGKSEYISKQWIFPILMTFLYLLVAFFDFNTFRNLISGFYSVFCRVLPILPLIFGLIFLSNLFIKPDQVKKYLGEGSGLKGFLISIVGGIISTGPIYVWYPLLSDFKSKGMRVSLIAVFLCNRAIKIPLLPLMIFYFGWQYVVVLSFFMISFSIFNGLLTERLLRTL